MQRRNRLRYFLDTEFIEDGRTIDLISIGIAADDGRTYYAENSDCDLARASDWVRENVFPHLTGSRKPCHNIAEEVVAFTTHAVGAVESRPRFWGYYCDYDWVALCQLYGKMIDLPRQFPKYCLDLKQLCYHLGDPDLPRNQSVEHHALADAEWIKDTFHWLHDRASALRGPIVS